MTYWTLLAAQPNPWMVLTLRIVFFLVGVIMVGVGFYAIKTQRLLISGRQKRFMKLFGKEELTGRWATVGGSVQILIGVTLLLLPMVGPSFGLLSMHDTPTRRKPRTVRRTPQLPPGWEEPEPEPYVAPEPLSTPSIALPEVQPDDSLMVSGPWVGSPMPDIAGQEESAPDRGVLVGVQLTHGERHSDRAESIQFIYQTADQYELGAVWGKEQPRVLRGLAKPGYYVGGIRLDMFAGRIRALQLNFYAVDPDQGEPRYEETVLGDDGFRGSLRDGVDAGAPIVRIEVGQGRGERIEALRFHFLDQDLAATLTQTPEALPELTTSTPVPRELRFWERVSGGNEYAASAPTGGLLVGLRVFVPAGNERVLGLQPLFQQGTTYSAGPLPEYAFANAVPTTVLAKPGYALGGWKFVDRGQQMQVQFMRVTEDGLDTGDQYTTAWLGNEPRRPSRSPEEHSWQSEGDVVVGLGYVTGSGLAQTTLLAATPGAESAPEPNTTAVAPPAVTDTSETMPSGEAGSEPVARKWTSRGGKTIDAVLVRYDSESHRVTLKRAGRKAMTIPANQLSDEDQAFLRGLARP